MSMLATYIVGCRRDPCFASPPLCSCNSRCLCNFLRHQYLEVLATDTVDLLPRVVLQTPSVPPLLPCDEQHTSRTTSTQVPSGPETLDPLPPLCIWLPSGRLIAQFSRIRGLFLSHEALLGEMCYFKDFALQHLTHQPVVGTVDFVVA